MKYLGSKVQITWFGSSNLNCYFQNCIRKNCNRKSQPFTQISHHFSPYFTLSRSSRRKLRKSWTKKNSNWVAMIPWLLSFRFCLIFFNCENYNLYVFILPNEVTNEERSFLVTYVHKIIDCIQLEACIFICVSSKLKYSILHC